MIFDFHRCDKKFVIIDFNRLNWLINRQISSTIEYYRLIDYIFDDRFLSIRYVLIVISNWTPLDTELWSCLINSGYCLVLNIVNYNDTRRSFNKRILRYMFLVLISYQVWSEPPCLHRICSEQAPAQPSELKYWHPQNIDVSTAKKLTIKIMIFYDKIWSNFGNYTHHPCWFARFPVIIREAAV